METKCESQFLIFLSIEKVNTVLLRKLKLTIYFLYPLPYPLKKTSQKYLNSFVTLITLKPVLELYCKTGFPYYKTEWLSESKYDDYGGWVTCDTLLLPDDDMKLYSLQESISRGTYDPTSSEEWIGCVCPKKKYMFGYRASKHMVDGKHLLSMEIKCGEGKQWA